MAAAVADSFVAFLNKAVSPFHAVEECAALLRAAGFKELREADQWNVKPNDKCFVTRNKSSIVAFAVGGRHAPDGPQSGFSVVAAHTDSPCLKLKPVSKLVAQGHLLAAVSTYGGGLWRTWFDRDLAVAGRLLYKTGDGRIGQKLVHIDGPAMFLPSLCIHLDTDRGNNFTPNKETHLRPVMATEKMAKEHTEEAKEGENEPASEHHAVLLRALADRAGVQVPDIVDFELCLLDAQPACVGGLLKEFVSGGRLDNLVGTYTAVRALIDSLPSLADDTYIRLAACYDNEECGSESAQGAGTALTQWIMHRLAGEHMERMIARSFLVSADQAHAVHPNYADKHEDRHRPPMTGGVVVKINANQRYASTPVSLAVLRLVAQRAGVQLHKFVVRNDSPCGSTIGPILSTRLGMLTVDVGTAQLAMHSCRELADAAGIADALKLFTCFYEALPVAYNSVDM